MANSIRVAQIVGKMNGGGVEAVVMNYYRHIDRSKVQFDFLVDSDSTLIPREEIESLGGRVFEIPPYQHVVEYQRELQRLFKQEGWKVVHSHINALSVFPLRAAKKAGVPVRIAHSHSTSGKGEYAKNILKAVLKTQSNRYPTHRFACSKFAGEWLFGKDANFEVVYNAIDLVRFSFNAEARAKARADLGLVGNQFAIGHVGRFTAQKNHSFLIDVFSEVAKRRDDAVLLLVGTGEAGASVKALVDERGLTDRVKFLGQRSDVSRLYQAFDAFVLPSLYEGLGLVGVEAQVAGLPCLFSDAITREVDVTGESKFLSIEKSDVWVKEISAIHPKVDRSIDLSRFRNYDIEFAAKALSAFYESL
ncbi:glycosyltransferase family 1 protein [Collinsella sp. TF09-1AT]|uniref:glycosyltransferase family 1 protein n=1 Tax=Collinsella sp. TF09-1AT TaxID=2292334 RepID=UPI000E44533E|nr:glycosyltransferase family 1 protein [Collinsella sp. TF09-1AT]RGK82502.1 glycosyltransferase family 1 protein [Collinsella sp. TF09-1AT]